MATYNPPNGDNLLFEGTLYSPPTGNSLEFGATSLPTILKDIHCKVIAKKLEFSNINTDIRFFPAHDIFTDIRFVKIYDIIKDISSDIRFGWYLTALKDISTDVRYKVENLINIVTDIRFGNFLQIDKNILTDVRFAWKYNKIHDIFTDIRFVVTPADIPTLKNFYIEEGDYTNSTTITLKIDYDDYAVKMQFKNESTGVWSTLENINDTKTWETTPGDGTKTVYCRLWNSSGYSNILSDTIIVDSSSPSISQINCLTEEEGTVVNDSTWTSEYTPYFYWSPPTLPSGLAGYSWAINHEPSTSMLIPIPNNYIISGCAISQGPTDWQVTVASGNYWYGEESSIGSVVLNISASDIFLNRIDVVYIDLTTLTVTIKEGTPAEIAVIPNIPAASLKLAEINVDAGLTSIQSGNIIDKRQLNHVLDLSEFNFREDKNTFKIRAVGNNGNYGPLATFNLWCGPRFPNPYVFLRGYDSSSKNTEYKDGQIITDNLIYVEWEVPAGFDGLTYTYYYTTDGTEPTSTSNNTLNNYIDNITLTEGINIIKVKVKAATGDWGDTSEFRIVYTTGSIQGGIAT